MSVRTVQRWETEFGLPVRRVCAGPGQPVHAFAEDIEQWRARAESVSAGRNVRTPRGAGPGGGAADAKSRLSPEAAPPPVSEAAAAPARAETGPRAASGGHLGAHLPEQRTPAAAAPRWVAAMLSPALGTIVTEFTGWIASQTRTIRWPATRLIPR